MSRRFVSCVSPAAAVVGGLLLGACAASDVVPTGGDTYTVSKRYAGSSESAIASARNDATQEATQFCAKDGRAFDKVRLDEQAPAESTGSNLGTQGMAVLQFRCLSPRPAP